MVNSTDYHIPVLLQECMEGLAINPEGTYVDATFGGGGHARKIFEKLSNKGTLFGVDQDQDALENSWAAPNFHFVKSNFRFIQNHLGLHGVQLIDGLLADLGVSSHQFDVPNRGFSLRVSAPLDMRMNKSGAVTAADILNNTPENDLYLLFRTYSDILHLGKLINNILRFRMSKPFETTKELVDVALLSAPKGKENKYLAQVFQAIRIEVNQELDALKELLEQSAKILKPGGRLVVMSYHSLEDRIVKNYLKRGSFDGEIEKDFFGNVLKPFTEITRHPIVPSDDEIVLNSRSRSAKLRIAVRNEG
jgi:16S rRNA (cytosine1402-N4)-methyltransferase